MRAFIDARREREQEKLLSWIEAPLLDKLVLGVRRGGAEDG
jgi:hypothetical protein